MEVGKKYIVKEHDSWFVGMAAAIVPFGVLLEKAAWIANMGCHFHTFLENGRSDNMEIETFPKPYCVRWDGYMEWPHPLFEASV